MDIPRILINYIEDSLISYKTNTNVVNWVKIIAIDITVFLRDFSDNQLI